MAPAIEEASRTARPDHTYRSKPERLLRVARQVPLRTFVDSSARAAGSSSCPILCSAPPRGSRKHNPPSSSSPLACLLRYRGLPIRRRCPAAAAKATEVRSCPIHWPACRRAFCVPDSNTPSLSGMLGVGPRIPAPPDGRNARRGRPLNRTTPCRPVRPWLYVLRSEPPLWSKRVRAGRRRGQHRLRVWRTARS